MNGKRKAARREAQRTFRLRHGAVVRDKNRRYWAERQGYLPPPPEISCPPKPSDGLCQFCSEKHGGLVLDHDHDTGNFRGWICRRCNRAFAFIERLGLQKFANYLHQSNQITAPVSVKPASAMPMPEMMA